MATNHHDPLAHILQAAEHERAVQNAMGQALQAAMNQPHTLERYGSVGIAVREENGQKILMVATVDGRRRDAPLSPDAVLLLQRQLSFAAEAETDGQAA
jgi:outer membrane lipoprotein SlyB